MQPSPVKTPHHASADLVLGMLCALEHLADPRVEQGLALNQLEHALQTATRAERAGADEEMVVAALCHDLGKLFTWRRHGPIAAEILRPFVRPEVCWTIAVHEDFTPPVRADGAVDATIRRRHRGERGYQLATEFVDDYDLPAVDPEYPTLPLEHFEPMIRRVFEAPRYHGILSRKEKIVIAALRPLRRLLGTAAPAFEDAVLDKTRAAYKIAKAPVAALRSAARKETD